MGAHRPVGDDSWGAKVVQLWKRALTGPIGNDWHWLAYNFKPGTDGSHYFTPLLLEALMRAEDGMPGYGETMIGRLEQIHGRVMDKQDYNAILQWLAEVLVIDHLVQHEWPAAVRFETEPTAGSKKNPEIVVHLDGIGSLGVEVKCPNLDAHRDLRSKNLWQLIARTAIDPQSLAGGVTLPRDNPVKDFLRSADEKFEGFRAQDASFRSVLFVVWDDFVREPLSALLAPSSGLLTPASFAKADARSRAPYPNVDAVVLIRHQHQFVNGMANRKPVDDRRHFLDYGAFEAFPPHALVPNPDGRPLRQEWLDALGAREVGELTNAGAEYHPGEVVMWFDPHESTTDLRP